MVSRKTITLFSLSFFLFIFSAPGFFFPILIFVALVPIFFLLEELHDRLSTKKIFLYTLLFWFLIYFFIDLWVINSLVTIFKANVFLSVFIYSFLDLLFFALPQTIFSLLFVRLISNFKKFPLLLKQKHLRKLLLTIGIILIALFWGFTEYLRGDIFPKLNISTLSSFLYSTPNLLHLLYYTGEYLFSGIIVAINIITYLFFKNFSIKSFFKKKQFLNFFAFTFSIILIFFILYSGNSNNKNLDAKKFIGIQANIPSKLKWKKQFFDTILEKYERLTLKAKPEEKNIILWPETAINFYPQQNSIYTKKLLDFANQYNLTILAGAPEFEKIATGYKYYNSIFMFDKDGRHSVYRKEMLLPFAEYCPVSFLYPIFKKVIGETQFSSFKNNKSLSLKNLDIGMAICFETTSHKIIKKRTLNRDLLIVFSDDIWLGKNFGPKNHLASIVLRAIENKQWVISIVNSGISAIISPSGKIINKIDYNREGILSLP